MKKQTILILAYTLVVALVISVKVIQTYVMPNQIPHASLLADCGDPPVPTPPGE